MHLRHYGNRLDVHLASLNQGSALAGVDVSLMDRDGQLLARQKSSPQGLATFEGDLNNAHVAIARQGPHYSMVPLTRPALDLSNFDMGQRPQRPLELFVYGPRTLYRPGEQVDFSGLLRDGDGQATTATPLSAKIIGPNGTTITTFNWRPQQLGYYHHRWLIPVDAAVGRWQLQINGPFAEPMIYDFQIEEFLPERMTLTYQPATPTRSPLPEGIQQVVDAQSPITLPLTGAYLYGAPAGGNLVDNQIMISQWRRPLAQYPQFDFGDVSHDDFQQRFDTPQLRLDADGRATLTIEPRWQDSRGPMKITTHSSLFDNGGRPVNRRFDTLIWPSASQLGIRSSFGDHNPAANGQVAFDIIHTTLAGQLLAADALEIKLIREDRQYFWVYNDYRGWHYEWTDKEYVESQSDLAIAAGEMGHISLPVAYGRYRFEIRDRQNKLVSSVRFYAGFDWYTHWQDSQQGGDAARPDQVTLAWDKASYQPGDIAKLRIVPPYAGQALILIEGDTPLWQQRMAISAEGQTVEIPVDASWQHHNLYASAVVIRNVDVGQLPGGQRSMGLLHLPLDRQARTLDLSITVPDTIAPLTRLSATIALASDSNQPPPPDTWITLAAVDVGILSLNRYRTPDPAAHFFGQRRYTVDSRDIYQALITQNDGPLAQLRFGGDADVGSSAVAPLTKVNILSLFHQPVRLDEAGKAVIEMDIPEFNGRVRLMALAFADNAFGSSDTELTIAAPVISEPLLPRFLARGDQSTLTLDLHNRSGQSQQLTVGLILGEAIRLRDPAQASQHVALADDEKVTLHYDIEGRELGIADIAINVRGQGFTPITQQRQLAVRPPYPREHLVFQQRLAKNDSSHFDQQALSGFLPNSINARLSLSNQAPLQLARQFEALLGYPYGCLEQTTSRAMPLLYATKDNQRRWQTNAISQPKRQQLLDVALQRLAGMQRRNGSFGLWPNDDSEQHWLTAYVGDFLLRASEQGLAVPLSLRDKTLDRLGQYLSHNRRLYGERWSDSPQHYRLAYRSYAAWVLSRLKKSPPGLVCGPCGAITAMTRKPDCR